MIKKIGVLGLLLLVKTAAAVPFTHGDFSSAGGWTDFSATGSAQVIGGEAVLETGIGSDPFSAVLLQGDDGFFNFPTPISLDPSDNTLSFDVRFENLGVDTTESGGSFFTDYLIIALYDADDATGASDLIFDPGIDLSVSTMTTYNLDISGLTGHDVALSFELSDEEDGLNSRAYLDNVRFYQASIPEPQSLTLFALGVLFFFAARTKCRKKIFVLRRKEKYLQA